MAAPARKAIHVYVTPEEHETISEFSYDHGVTISAMIAILSARLADVFTPAMIEEARIHDGNQRRRARAAKAEATAEPQ